MKFNFRKIIVIGLVAIACIGWIITCYCETSTLHDFLMCNLILVLVVAFWYFVYYLMKKKIINIYVMMFCYTIGMYMWFYLNNLYFIMPAGHYGWIGGVFPIYYAYFRDYKIKFSFTRFAAFMIVTIITISGLFYILDDKMSGVNKFERAVKNYLVEDKNNKRSDFEEIRFQKDGYKYKSIVCVRFKDEPKITYVYRIVNSKVVQIVINTGYQEQKEFKHIENKDVVIYSRKLN